MKVLLVAPPSNALTITPPLGLGYLASTLRENSYDVGILDCLKEGINVEQAIRKIKEINPSVVGISVVTATYNNMKKIVNRIKKNNPDIKIVVGGPHASVLPGPTLKGVNADYLVMGEGEHTFLDLMDFIKKSGKEPDSIEGLCYKENGEVIINVIRKPIDNLNSIPFPAWDLIPPNKYPPAPHQLFFKSFPIAPIMTSRGCPFRCSFCSSGAFLGRKLRLRSPKEVVDEIELLVNKYGVKEIHFEDDNFTLIKDHAKAICREIIARNIKIVWQSPNGVRIDSLDDELIYLMKESGCYRLAFGIESASQKILDRANKMIDLRKVPDAIKKVKKAGIEAHGFFILGLPGETRETAMETINFATKLSLDLANFALLVPLPGSQIFKECYGADIEKINWDEFNYFSGYTVGNLSLDNLRKFQKIALRKFYSNPKVAFNLLRRIRIRQIPYLFKVMMKYLA